MKWEIEYYSDKVIKWLNGMPVSMKAYYARITERMQIYGADLGMPFARSMKNGLFELRIKFKDGISCVFYCTVQKQKNCNASWFC